MRHRRSLARDSYRQKRFMIHVQPPRQRPQQPNRPSPSRACQAEAECRGSHWHAAACPSHGRFKLQSSDRTRKSGAHPWPPTPTLGRGEPITQPLGSGPAAARPRRHGGARPPLRLSVTAAAWLFSTNVWYDRPGPSLLRGCRRPPWLPYLGGLAH